MYPHSIVSTGRSGEERSGEARNGEERSAKEGRRE
jgi:hypothetical protein